MNINTTSTPTTILIPQSKLTKTDTHITNNRTEHNTTTQNKSKRCNTKQHTPTHIRTHKRHTKNTNQNKQYKQTNPNTTEPNITEERTYQK